MEGAHQVVIEGFNRDSIWVRIDGQEFWAPYGDLEEHNTALHQEYLAKLDEFQAAVKTLVKFIGENPVEGPA